MNIRESFNEQSIDRAEDAISNSIARFESAMERLCEKVEDSSKKLHHVMDLGKRQKDELLHLKDQAKQAVNPLMKSGKVMAERVRENPRPYVWSGLALLGISALIGYYFWREEEEAPRSFGDPLRPESIRSNKNIGDLAH